MLRDFFQRRRENKLIREWQNSSLGKALAHHTNEYFHNNPRLARLSDDSKNKHIGDFIQQIIILSKAENPFLAMREALASCVIGYAKYQVLCLTEEEKDEDIYSDCPYISGELYKHIDKAVKHIDELGELKWKYPSISNEELVSFCNTKCVLHLYYVNGFNYVRGEFDDFDKEKDWLRPFIKSMLIWEEDQIRNKIGLPSLLPGSLYGLKHSTFMNIVINGHKNPYYEWEKNWSEENA